MVTSDKEDSGVTVDDDASVLKDSRRACQNTIAAIVCAYVCVLLQGPALPSADVSIYCTGYRYKFPFLEQHADIAGLSGQQHVPGGCSTLCAAGS
jgi:hypothetical protein